MKQLAIIGLGQLGSRHLQALANINEVLAIELVDISVTSLDLAVSRFYEMPNAAKFKGTITKHTSVIDLSENQDIVIIACNSRERRGLAETLLNTKKVKYLILEKVLFPTLEDYDSIGKLLVSKNVKAWVNCSRRMMPSYRNIKQLLTPGAALDFSISASNWGMGSNGIHFIDLFCFLTGNYDLNLEYDLLDDTNPIDSSRKGYIDFTGTYTGRTEKGDFFKMTSYKNGTLPPVVIITTPFERITVYEYLNRATYVSEKNDWKSEDIEFRILFQSQLTTLLVDQLFANGDCFLPSYEEAKQTHLLFLNSLIDYQRKKLGIELLSCQIS